MSPRDLCDVAYVLQIDALERWAVTAAAFGGEVDPEEVRGSFDDALNEAPPKRLMTARMAAMRQLVKEREVG